MVRKIKLSLSVLVASLTILCSGAQYASAATASSTTTNTGSGNGLRLSPVRTDLTIKPGTTSTVNINVTNVTGASATLTGIINDFVANPDESGDPAIILDPNQYASTHSLKRFVQPIGDVTLAAGQQKSVTVTIKVPANAAGGGYYGAVRFAPASVAKSSAGQNVSLAGSVGSLILVKVPGNIKEQLSIASFDVRKNNSPSSFFTTKKNLNVVVRLQNEGNIQEAPFGKILLKNRSGKTLATYELNATYPPGNVLPDSIRRFTIPLSKIGSFGQFKLEGNFGYGSGGQLLTASTTFYVIPTSLIIIFIVIVLLLAFIIFVVPKLIRAYNRRVIRRANRRKTK